MIPLTLRTAEDDSDRKLLSDVATHGWHVVMIEGDEEGPGYLFTVGLYYNYEHPELLIMGLPRDVSYQLLHEAVGQIQKGKKYSAESDDTELASFPLAFRSVDIGQYRPYLGYGIWFYENCPTPFPALQMVWPDKEGKFPWQDGYDERFLAHQPSLYRAEP